MYSAYLRAFSIAAGELAVQSGFCTWFFQQNSLCSKSNLTKFLRWTVKGPEFSATLDLENARGMFLLGCPWQMLVTASGLFPFGNSQSNVSGRCRVLLRLKNLGTITTFLAEHRYQLDSVFSSAKEVLKLSTFWQATKDMIPWKPVHKI